jgi:DNA-binding transcriptional MocR family regulator
MIQGLKIDPENGVPVYRQIADEIRAAALDGRLPSGRRLPPTRDLARHLGVNRNTVVAAYDWLASEGVVRSQTGRGTFLVSSVTDASAGVRGAATDDAAVVPGFARAVEGPLVGSLLSVYRIALSTEGISFAGSYPAKDLMPVEAFRSAMTEVLAEAGAEVLSYGPTAGHAALRGAIADDMRKKGSRVVAEDILVTNGSQQGLDLIFRAFVDPGDPVVLEEPTYTGARSVLHSLGARPIGVPVDDEGIRTDLLAAALERHRPRLIYVQPTFHNPTTAVLPEARRREILSLAARYRCLVVEDDWGGDLRFEGADLPTLHALDGGRRVIYVSTFSKKLLPGVRVGWVAAPPAVLERLIMLKQIEDCGTSPLVQAALHSFLAAGGLATHLRRVRPAYRERRDALLTALERHFPRQATWTRPVGGLFVWVTLPDGIDSADLLADARTKGVLFNEGDLFHVEGGGRRTLRLSYGGVGTSQIQAGIEILGRLAKERDTGGRNEEARRAVEAVPIL